MNRKILITVLILLCALSVNAQTLSSVQVKNDVTDILQKSYTKMTNADVEVKIIATTFNNLVLPDGKVSYKITQGGDKIVPRDIKRVDVFVDGTFIKSLNLPTQTSVYKEVLVASDVINREQAITKDNTVLKKMDISLRADYVLEKGLLNKEMSAKKSFRKDEILDKRFVQIRPDVVRNMDVKIFFVSNGAVMITIDGTAMADGMTGDYVTVENRQYKKCYKAKVVGENKVLVNI